MVLAQLKVIWYCSATLQENASISHHTQRGRDSSVTVLVFCLMSQEAHVFQEMPPCREWNYEVHGLWKRQELHSSGSPKHTIVM